MPREFYRCNKCGKEFSDWGECSYHEDIHVGPNWDSPVVQEWVQDRIYPNVIKVKMYDGAEVLYEMKKSGAVVKGPDPKEESELETEE